MTSPPTIGHYVVERELGRGAMGVVYLASDTRLGRLVAIKALPATLALDPLRQIRFDREARTLAAISHPNIGAIFGIEEAQGARYLVLELIEGETLAERLAFAPPREEAGGHPALDVPDALEIGSQVAAGMAAAHERGIIHRDLKPANIKIRPDGLVKVLDFGIARGGPVEQPQPGSPKSDAATVVAAPDSATTHIGTIVGTPGYMSPEQARGKPVGKASDLWSFGCMIFECLTGRVAFGGATLADALASTLTTEPDYDQIPRATPARVIALLKRCFEKDQYKRLDDFSEARNELDRAIAELTGVGTPGPTLPPLPEENTEGWASTAGNIREPSTDFIDRPGELAELSRLLASPGHVSVVGIAGSGKTRLVLHAVGSTPPPLTCGAWYIDAAPVKERWLLGARLALAIHARCAEGEKPAAAVIRQIGPRRTLVVIDSCQHAPHAIGELVGEILDACPRATVVTVGREPIGLRREPVYRVPPMSIPDDDAPEGAAALLRRRARVACSTLDATPESPGAIRALCRRLQGLPLPIELAAAWSELPTFTDVNTLLDDRLRTLGVAGLESQPADQVVRLAVDWAYQQVSEGERGMLRRLSTFVDGCTLRAAAAISGAADSFPDPASADPAGGPLTQQEARVLDLVTHLASLSLLTMTRSENGSPADTRIRLHEPVRLLARERLMEFTGAVSVVKRHAQFYLALVEQAAPRVGGADGPAWAARMAAELPNILAAADGAESMGDATSASRLREHTIRFLRAVGLPID